MLNKFSALKTQQCAKFCNQIPWEFTSHFKSGYGIIPQQIIYQLKFSFTSENFQSIFFPVTDPDNTKCQLLSWLTRWKCTLLEIRELSILPRKVAFSLTSAMSSGRSLQDKAICEPPWALGTPWKSRAKLKHISWIKCLRNADLKS